MQGSKKKIWMKDEQKSGLFKLQFFGNKDTISSTFLLVRLDHYIPHKHAQETEKRNTSKHGKQDCILLGQEILVHEVILLHKWLHKNQSALMHQTNMDQEESKWNAWPEWWPKRCNSWRQRGLWPIAGIRPPCPPTPLLIPASNPNCAKTGNSGNDDAILRNFQGIFFNQDLSRNDEKMMRRAETPKLLPRLAGRNRRMRLGFGDWR